ncbi:MAG: hypothetical protein AAFV95_22670 [Bacteroidota bacterium]
MFEKLFGRWKKDGKGSVDVFAKWNDLPADKKKSVDDKALVIQQTMFGKKGVAELHAVSRVGKRPKPSTYKSVQFDSLGWKQERNVEGDMCLYHNEIGDYLTIQAIQPNGRLEPGGSTDIDTYRDWIRSLVVDEDGGLISCEQISRPDRFDAYESITKVARKETTGVDYTYLLNLQHYGEQLLYQLIVRVHELSPTGVRDNTLMSPICDVMEMDMTEVAKYYRQDPYNSGFTKGNVRNLSELEAFDHLYPFHPLSAIRQVIRPRLLKSVRLKN